MQDYLNKAMEIQLERNKQAKAGNRTEVRVQEGKLAEVFKQAKADGIDIGELNNQLIQYTSKSF